MDGGTSEVLKCIGQKPRGKYGRPRNRKRRRGETSLRGYQSETAKKNGQGKNEKGRIKRPVKGRAKRKKSEEEKVPKHWVGFWTRQG